MWWCDLLIDSKHRSLPTHCPFKLIREAPLLTHNLITVAYLLIDVFPPVYIRYFMLEEINCFNSYTTFPLQNLVVNFQVLGAEDGSIKAFPSPYLSAKMR